MSKTYFIVSDVHGFYNILQNTLQCSGFDKKNPEHIFVSLGDITDRGENSLGCLRFANEMYSMGRAILIRGNHEDLLEDCLIRREFGSHDYHNGTYETVVDLASNGDMTKQFNSSDKMFLVAKNNKEYNTYINSLVDYYEDENSVFVHGWIPCKTLDPNQYHSKDVKYIFDDNWRTGNWRLARWINGMNAWSQGIIVPNKTVYCGHWHTSWGHANLHQNGVEFQGVDSQEKAIFDPFMDTGICACDACTAYSKQINCIKLEMP